MNVITITIAAVAVANKRLRKNALVPLRFPQNLNTATVSL